MFVLRASARKLLDFPLSRSHNLRQISRWFPLARFPFPHESPMLPFVLPQGSLCARAPVLVDIVVPRAPHLRGPLVHLPKCALINLVALRRGRVMSILPRIEMLLATNAASAKTGWVGVVAAPEPTVGDFFVYEALEVSLSCVSNA